MLSRKTEGTGLGLYLSRAIVKSHGGEMDVDSVPGQGSVFYFTLPR
jgi:signal transduction histidine kinase